MIKRFNKVTALLVAAAAVVSIVPATAANAAERLQTKQGTINSAIAFDGGKYLFNGYKTNDDETANYYNAGDKDKQLEDLKDMDTIAKYDSKYAKVSDSNDEYLVDLSTGKILDEDSSDIESTLTTKLRSSLKKTDRYSDLKDTDTLKLDSKLKSNSFADTWYKYTATTNGGATATLFTNKDGKYIDASYLANMTVVKDDNTTVKVDKFGKEKDGVTLNLVSIDPIAQDKDNIYTKTVVTTDGAAKLTYIQKISKAQGEKQDDAYLPKKVESYDITTKFDSSDVDKANEIFNKTDVTYNVIDGVLYATEVDSASEKVNMTTIKLKKDKLALTKGGNKLDVYVAEKDQDDDQDIQNGAKSVSYDVNGNTWAINKGSIYKFDGKQFKEMYTCDRSIDTLDVYNESSLVAWEDGQDVYTTVQEGKVDPIAPVAPQTGWVNTAAGWTFYDAAGKQVQGSWVNAGGAWYMIKADGIMATGWYNDNGTWYFLNASGAMQTGWVNNNGTWYYLQSSGAMKTGWLNDNGTWYYLNANGSMAANTTVDGYTLGANGAWVR